jgi:hypothetical protein
MNPGASRRCFATHLGMTELHSHGHETRSLDRDIQINRLCKPANPAFTISKMTNMRAHFGVLTHVRNTDISVTDTRFCLAGLPSRSSRGSARLRPMGFDAATFSRFASEGWWSRSGSNRRPQACKARALPTELRPQKSVRSGLPSRSCGRKPVFAPKGSDAAAFATSQRRLVGPGRVERPTSRLSGVRSNHLSYEPETR